MSIKRILLLAVLGVAAPACKASTARVASEAPTGVTVQVYPPWARVAPGASQQFAATVTGTAISEVTWSVQEGAAGGMISTSGLYTAPQQTGASTYTVVAASAASPTVKGTATVTVTLATTPPPPPAKARYIGGHVPEISTWTAPVYANALAQGSPWEDFGGTRLDLSGRLDNRGNPTVDARILFMAGTGPGPSSVVAGTHKLSFNGQADVNVESGSVANKVYDAALNLTTADVAVPSSGPNYRLELTNAWRRADHAADATGNARGVTNVRLMAPGHTWPTDYFRKEVQAMNAVLSLIRFEWALGPSGGGYSCNNGTSGVMGSCDTTWSTRSRPGFYGYSAKGMPWEDTVVLANMIGMDIWVNIPINADNDYVTKVFQLLKYGSDGDLPFTAPTYDPATWTPGAGWYPGLLPGRKVYVEFTNELFTYYDYGDSYADAHIAAGDAGKILAGGHFTTEGRGDRWGAFNAIRISILARQVWGNEAMQNTIRIVYANQGDWGDWGRHQYALDYIEYVWGPASPWSTIDGFANPKQPVSYYLHNISGSFYVHTTTTTGSVDAPPTATTVGSVGTLGNWDDGSGFLQDLKRDLSCVGGRRAGAYATGVYERHQWGENMAARYGIKFSTYETGLEIFNRGSVAAAWNDTGMRTIYYWLLRHMMDMPHADVAVESATVRGVYPGNELSVSYAASAGFPWPISGTAAPSPGWQAIVDLAAGR